MKIRSTLIAAFLLLFLWIPTSSAQALYTEGWEVTDFHSRITLNEDGTVMVSEIIDADFTNEPHRGLARIIPYKYKISTFETRDTKIKFLLALDQDGNQWDTTILSYDGFREFQMREAFDNLLIGPATFLLEYEGENIINFFDDHDEFYWNVNGTDWVVPFTGDTQTTITLPDSVDPNDLKFNCFTGAFGSESQDCEYQITPEGKVNFYSTVPRKAYEGLTIVVGFPKGIFAQPSALSKLLTIIAQNWPFILPLLSFIIMLSLYLKKGRDDQSVADTIIPRYTPPKDLLATEVGTLIDERVHPQDISASIVELAVQGLIQIHETKKKRLIGSSKDYELELLKPYDPTKNYQLIILQKLFPDNKKGEKVKISDLGKKIILPIKRIHKSIISELVTNGYFPHSPATTRTAYFGFGGGLLFIAQFFMGFSLVIAIGIFGAAIPIIGFAYFMPRKTKKGTEKYYELKGLYEYIETAEKDRLKFQEDAGIMFEKILPYAVAFGLTKKWANAFKDILKVPPTWYTGYAIGDGFNLGDFSNSLNKVTERISTSVTPKGKTGGWSGGSGFSGGFSGGGFGGGGGRGL